MEGSVKTHTPSPIQPPSLQTCEHTLQIIMIIINYNTTSHDLFTDTFSYTSIGRQTFNIWSHCMVSHPFGGGGSTSYYTHGSISLQACTVNDHTLRSVKYYDSDEDQTTFDE